MSDDLRDLILTPEEQARLAVYRQEVAEAEALGLWPICGYVTPLPKALHEKLQERERFPRAVLDNLTKETP